MTVIARFLDYAWIKNALHAEIRFLNISAKTKQSIRAIVTIQSNLKKTVFCLACNGN